MGFKYSVGAMTPLTLRFLTCPWEVGSLPCLPSGNGVPSPVPISRGRRRENTGHLRESLTLAEASRSLRPIAEQMPKHRLTVPWGEGPSYLCLPGGPLGAPRQGPPLPQQVLQDMGCPYSHTARGPRQSPREGSHQRVCASVPGGRCDGCTGVGTRHHNKSSGWYKKWPG